MTTRHDYNPAALQRIRCGACAADLGWDEKFYRGVCRKHGLEPMPSPPVTVERNSVAVPAAAVALADAPIVTRPKPKPMPMPKLMPTPKQPPADGLYVLRKSNALIRNSIRAALTPREMTIMQYLAANTPGAFLPGLVIGKAMGISREYVGVIISAMRPKLKPLQIEIASLRGRPGGYTLLDAKTKSAIVVAEQGGAS